MASPQVENGHVDLANEIVEALARTRIPGEARQVLDFILRKTYGWHKKEDAISLTQFERGTGLKRSNVCSSIKRLIKMNLIYKGSMERDTGSPQKDTIGIQVYGFQKDFDKWMVVPKKILSPQKDNRVVPKKIHTKETITKEIKHTSLEFNLFWKAYPKKIGKGASLKAWNKIKPGNDLVEKMISKIEIFKKTDQWTKDQGQFIPNPATWLNQGRWDDEVSTIKDKW